jgi:hypothetical protein
VCAGEAHRNVRALFDPYHNGLKADGKQEGDQQNRARSSAPRFGAHVLSEKVERLG